MSERPVFPQQRPEAPVHACWIDGRWRLGARGEGHQWAATASPPLIGVVTRSAVRLGQYLAIVIDFWVPGDPATPMLRLPRSTGPTRAGDELPPVCACW